MKSVFHKISSVTLAVLLLLSTVSWTVDKHLCMGRVMDIAFFAKTEDCGMKAAMDLLEEEGIENHCCDDESFTYTGQDDLSFDLENINLEQHFFLAIFTHSYVALFVNAEEDTHLNKEYPPPLLVYDIQLLDQVFLI